MNEKLKEGDRVKIRHEDRSTGTIDEIYSDHYNGQPTLMATILFDESGCCGDRPIYDLEKING